MMIGVGVHGIMEEADHPYLPVTMMWGSIAIAIDDVGYHTLPTLNRQNRCQSHQLHCCCLIVAMILIEQSQM